MKYSQRKHSHSDTDQRVIFALDDDLGDEAKQAVQDAYTADWQAYWVRVAYMATEHKSATTVEGRDLARGAGDARYVLSLSARAGSKGDLCQRP